MAQSPWKAAPRSRALLAAAVMIVAGAGLTAVSRAQGGPGSSPGRVALEQDVAKLTVVVMANQTPISQADAQAVLPVLQKIQTKLEASRENGPLDEATATDLDAQLRAALPAGLSTAVGAVRLLTPKPPAGLPADRPGPPPGDDQGQAGPPPGGGPGGRHGGRGPGGGLGLQLLGPLTDFFQTTASG